MFKKIFSLILCLIIALGVLTGCTLFEDRVDEDLAQIVAEIKPYWVHIKRTKTLEEFTAAEISLVEAYNSNANTENIIRLSDAPEFSSDDLAGFAACGVNPYYEDSYETDHITITKYALLQQANNNAEQVIQNEGQTVEYLFNTTLQQMINTELILLEIKRLVALGQLKEPTLTQQNQIWKDAYDAIDSEIYNLMAEIAVPFNEDVPSAPQTGVDAEPTYAVKTVKAAEEDLDKDKEPWTPSMDVNRCPKPGSEEHPENYLILEGVRKYVERIIEAMEAREYLLNDKQKEEFAKDKEKFESYKDSKPNELVGVYEDLQNYFCIKYFYYDSSIDSYRIDNLRKMITDGVVVTDADVEDKYKVLKATQVAAYNNETSYKTGIDDTESVLIYRPYNVKQYYVKHILLPFSDEQKKLFAEGGNKSPKQLKQIRDNLIYSITSYAHVNGFDYIAGGLRTYNQIVGEVETKMAGLGGHSAEAEAMFEELIFKYNTDPGIFNNEVGYGLRYGEKSSFMTEFEDASTRLYERYLEIGNKAIGTLDYAITDYGVHIMMLSSVLPHDRGFLELHEYTNVMRTETLYENIYNSLRDSKSADAFTIYQSTLLTKLKAERENDIITYEKRYKSFLKQ